VNDNSEMNKRVQHRIHNEEERIDVKAEHVKSQDKSYLQCPAPQE
jgi:hypothetical protein